MTAFDPGKFEDKYAHYFEELERAYRRAFETMNERYDSDLVHAIDQRVLNESEPMYDGGDGFRIRLPDDPRSRVSGLLVSDEKFDSTLTAYVEELETELAREFEFRG